jgi:hypothetical protein
MKLSSVFFALLFTMIVLSGCGAVETIFKAGMAWAFILVGLIVFLLIYLVMRARK